MSTIECNAKCDASNVTDDTPWVGEENNETCDKHLDICVQLGMLSRLKHTISSWCDRNKRGENLLDDSGVFVMYEVNNNSLQFPLEQDELIRFCSSEKMLHSRLIQTKKLSEEVNLGVVARMQVVNFENDLERIQTQFLRIQLWFVPIITTRIAAILNDNSLKDFKALNGCSLIAVGKVPLYHLYTIKGHFNDKVPLELHLRSMECGNYRQDGHLRSDLLPGHVTVSVYRVGRQISEFESNNNTLDKRTPASPHNEARRSQIDPPEEKTAMKKNREPLSGKKRKRVFNPQCVSEFKRHKHVSLLQGTVSEQIASDCANMTPSESTQNWSIETALPHENLDASTIGSRETEEGNKSRHDESVEIDDDQSLSYRSLSSVMESLANINAKFQITIPGKSPRDRISPTKFDEEHEIDVFEIKDPSREHEKDAETMRNESTKATPQKSSISVQTTFEKISTCEKASSPIKCTVDNVDASTSLPENDVAGENKDRSLGMKSSKHQVNMEPSTSGIESGFDRRCSNSIDANKDVSSVSGYRLEIANRVDSIIGKSQSTHNVTPKVQRLTSYSTQKNESIKERLERKISTTNHSLPSYKARMQSNFRSFSETPTILRRGNEFRLFDDKTRSAYSARKIDANDRINNVPQVISSNLRRNESTTSSVNGRKIKKRREEFSDEARRIERIFSGRIN